MSVVIRAIGFANGVSCPHAGQWLADFDFDAHEGVGYGEFTPDLARAKRFPHKGAAFLFWRTQSTVRRFRDDGQPNRPLTALSVDIEDVPP